MKYLFLLLALSPITPMEAAQVRFEVKATERGRTESRRRGAEHSADGPKVTQVCAVAPNVIAITLQAGQHVNNQLVPYVAQPGDEVVEEEKDKPRHAVIDGKVVDYFQKGLFRNGQQSNAPGWGCSLPTASGFSSSTDERAIA